MGICLKCSFGFEGYVCEIGKLIVCYKLCFWMIVSMNFLNFFLFVEFIKLNVYKKCDKNLIIEVS